jgi:protein O-GlcNAc transferase
VKSLAAGNLPASEIYCRNVLDMDGKNVAALNTLGIIAARVGAVTYSETYFKKVLTIDPVNSDALNNLAILKSVPRRPLGQGQRFLLIKSWGYGFWSDVSQVLGNLLLAEITGRTPVTHWGKNSLFGDGSGKDAFTLYFKPVSTVTLSDLSCRALEKLTYFPPKWHTGNLANEDVNKWHGKYSRAAAIYFLDRPETIAVSDFYVGVVDVAPWIPSSHAMHGRSLVNIYRYLTAKYLLPQPATAAACDAFWQAHFTDAKVVAVHARGSDKCLEDFRIERNNETLLSSLRSIDPTWRIFLLTDDEKWYARFKASYGDRVVATDCQRTSTRTGTHYLPSVNRARLGLEIMLDTYLALRADRFIGNGRSNVSAIIAIMKEWQEGSCTLVDRSALMDRNLFIYNRV